MELSAEAKMLKNQYQKEWRKRNKEKVKEYTNKHWEKKVKELQGA